MRQRVLIAMALLLNPPFIILDEPTTALDILTQRTIIDLLRALQSDLKFAMMFISHDLSLAAELANALSPPPTISGEAALALVPTPDAVIMGEEIQQRVRSSLFDAARRRAIEEDVQLITFGHTHEPGEEILPGGGRYFNTGTWTWKGEFGSAGKEAWRELFEHPERFTAEFTTQHQHRPPAIKFSFPGKVV